MKSIRKFKNISILTIIFSINAVFASFANPSHLGNIESGRHNINDFLLADSSLNTQSVQNLFESYQVLLSKFEQLRTKSKSDVQFLEKVFYKTHRVLKNYKTNAQFADIFSTGEYDCVTSTALYSLLLSDLGFQFTIYEFPFHTFLTVAIGDTEILFDGTDPIYGFITDKTSIETRITDYQTDFGQLSNSSSSYKMINLNELIGLHYYNLSVELFNKREYEESKKILRLSNQYYPNQRIVELSRYIAISE